MSPLEAVRTYVLLVLIMLGLAAVVVALSGCAGPPGPCGVVLDAEKCGGPGE